MKKFTLLMATAMVGISASAQLYVCGNKVNGASNWNPGTPVEVALTDGFYEFKAEGDFKMSTTKGDWNDFNANAKGVANNTWEVVSDTESKAALVAWDANTSSAKSGEEVSYKVNEALTEITATYSSGAIVYNVYLAGSFNEYNAADAAYKFTATDNADEFKYEWKGEFTGNFKVVVNGTWYGTYDPVVSGETYALYDTHDTNCTFDKKAVDPVFVFNVKTLALTVTYKTGGDDPEPQPGNKYSVYLNNTAKWQHVFVYVYPEAAGAWPGTEIYINEDGLFEWTVESEETPEFSVILFSDGDGHQTGDLTYEVGKTYENGEPVNLDNSKLYLVGDMTGWKQDDTYLFEKEGNVYTLNIPSLTGEWKIWNGSWDYSFGKGADQLVLGEEGQAWFNSNANFDLNFDKPVIITLTVTEGSDVQGSSTPAIIKVVDASTVGVSAIDATEGKAVYFNMQGVRVANPENGLFIRVQNGKAVKVAK